MNAPDLSRGISERADMINFYVSGWREFGYDEPPSPECQPVPPLGRRSAQAITRGHEAVAEIDRLAGDLHRLREQLVTELHQDSEIRAARVDALLAKGGDQ